MLGPIESFYKIHAILTVPEVWEPEAVNLMYDVAISAGFPAKSTFIVSEPEAAG